MRVAPSILVLTIILFAPAAIAQESPAEQAYDAIVTGIYSKLRRLLDEGLDANSLTVDNQHLLATALERNAYGAAMMLLENGANPDVWFRDSEDSISALALSVQSGTDTWVLEQMLLFGAEPNYAEPFGWSALLVAAKLGNLPAVRMLIEAGADPNLQTTEVVGLMTPLMYAARNGSPELIRYLIDAGADTSTRNWQGQTAVDIASEYSDGRDAAFASTGE